MTKKDLIKRLEKFSDDAIILTGDYLPNELKMGWDNIELVEFENQLYIVGSGIVEHLYPDQLKRCVVSLSEMIIEGLDFSVRTYNALKRHGINTIDDILALDKYEILKVRNLGLKNVAEIISVLAQHGLKLKDGEN